jgi:hypothetical protein
MHRLVTKFRDTGSVCLWQVLIERQNSWNYGRTDFKQWISCSNGIRLQEFNIAISFVVVSVKGFMCCSWGCVLHGTSYRRQVRIECLSVWVSELGTSQAQKVSGTLRTFPHTEPMRLPQSVTVSDCCTCLLHETKTLSLPGFSGSWTFLLLPSFYDYVLSRSMSLRSQSKTLWRTFTIVSRIDEIMPLWYYNTLMFSLQVVGDGNTQELGVGFYTI